MKNIHNNLLSREDYVLGQEKGNQFTLDENLNIDVSV